MAIEKNFYNPYTFIPLNDNIITYSKDEIAPLLEFSHDLPLSKDAVSGIVEFTMKAESPFCIKTDKNESVSIENRYFIPGTTIKGMMRNVFEIITLSNIKNNTANSRYSMRDLHSPDYKLKSADKEQKSGFIIQLNQKLFIVQCSSDSYTYEEIKENEGVDISKERTVKGKYSKLTDGYIFEDDGYRVWFFSGFMNNKKHEFLFDVPDNFVTETLYPINDDTYKDFIFIHEKENENENWKFWKRKLKNYNTIQEIVSDGYMGIIPCFFRFKKDNGKWIVRDLGFSYLYRQPYEKSIHDCLPDNYKNNNDFDMTQLVFGFSNSNTNLKGRISFSNSFLNDAIVDEQQTFIMGKPKATYYPFYLKQDKSGILRTYFYENANIAGWKRNLIHSEAKRGVSSGKTKIESSFIPIKAGASFRCKLRFHNLKDYELGALLSAITFHNSSECYHLLGYAKPFGYGKFKCTNLDLKLMFDKLNDRDFFISKFENEIKNKSDIEKWKITLSTLKGISSGNYHNKKQIRYPNLDSKEFENIKNSKYSLKDFNP